MKKKLILMLVTCCALFLFTGCVEEETVLSVNVENSNELNGSKFGKDALIEIGSGLYYDSCTRIVYFENVTYGGLCVYSPYYAPNGLPYKYNPETNTFEEIETSKQR